MTFVRRFRWIVVPLVLLAGGLARLPLEQGFLDEARARHLAEEPLNLSLREELGQNFFIAVLGGFRSLVASLVELESIDAWQDHEWEKVDAAYALATRLQPREYHYWDFRSWMSAYNAYDHYAWRDESRPGLREWRLNHYFNHGVEVLKEALRWLPNDYRVYAQLGVLVSSAKNANPNHAEAAEWYAKAYEKAPKRRSTRYLWRNHVFQLAETPGKELEAWRLLLELYNSPGMSDRTPTVDTLLVVTYPEAKKRDPSITLPADLEARREEILARYLEFQKRRGEPIPRVESPGFKRP